MAQADDERWRQFADVIVHREAAVAPALVAARTLDELPGCRLVAVPIRYGCVLVARNRPPVVVVGPVDVESVAAAAYSTLLSLARTSAALGSATCS